MYCTKCNIDTVFSVFSAPGALKMEEWHYHFYPVISAPPLAPEGTFLFMKSEKILVLCFILKDKGKIQNLYFKYTKNSPKVIMTFICISSSDFKKEGVALITGGGGTKYREYGSSKWSKTEDQTLKKVFVLSTEWCSQTATKEIDIAQLQEMIKTFWKKFHETQLLQFFILAVLCFCNDGSGYSIKLNSNNEIRKSFFFNYGVLTTQSVSWCHF